MNKRDNAALIAFDSLPELAFVSMRVAAALNAISEVTAWRWSKNGNLPPTAKIGPNTTVIQVGPLRASMRKRAAGATVEPAVKLVTTEAAGK